MFDRRALSSVFVTILCFLASHLALAQDKSTEHDPSKAATLIDGIRFSLAEGLRIDKVTDETLIKWPIVADWDNQGRLVVAESGGVGWPITEHNERKLHKLIRLVDSDGDGKFDQRIVAADGLAFPEGVLCLGNDVLVSAPPQIWKFTDSDGDGICEHREVWFDGKTVTNCANDLHGPYLGRDGWIYWCKGAFGTQTNELLDGRTMESSAAHIYRRRITGGPIEPVITGGMDNPVEVAFIPEGEKFFTSTFLQTPGGGLRDGIAHAVYGGVFGKDHSVLANHPRTGSLMPIMTQLGPAAPSGLACLESKQLAQFAEHDDASVLVAALFNLQKLTAHQLLPSGASYRTIDHDLVVADRVDFHPTDVIEDADGSLLLVDTGGWYDLCCPTSRIDQTTASGGIYRISSAATAKKKFERGSVVISPAMNGGAAAVELLYDSRPWVRRQTALKLATSGNESVASLESIVSNANRSIDDRITALWALCQIGTRDALAVLSKQLRQSNSSILQAACHAVAMHRDQDAVLDLQRLFDHSALPVRRAAAEALGRIGNETSMESLLEALEHCGEDRHLEHSLLYALINISRVSSVNLIALANSNTKLRAAWLVLDQVGRIDEIEVSRLFAGLNSNDSKLRSTAAEILARHPHWASSSDNWLSEMYMRIDAPNSAEAQNLASLVAGWRDQSSTQQLVATWIDEAATANPAQQLFLATRLSEFSPRKMPGSWTDGLANWLDGSNEPIQRKLAEGLVQIDIDSSGASKLLETLVRISLDAETLDLRLRLLAALPNGLGVDNSQLEQEIVAAFLSQDETLATLASKVLQRIKLANSNLLADSLVQVPARSLPTAIEAIHRSGIEAIESQVLASLASLPAAKTLPQTYLTNLYQRSSKVLRDQAELVANDLIRPPADVKATVDEMLTQLDPGDPVAGLQVFRSSKASCSGCHRIGYVGHDVGPELTRIGASRTSEALLEAILFPSARQEQSYQGSRLLTVDGQVHNGLVKRRTADSIELQITADRLQVIAIDQIEIIEPSEISVMPSGMAQQLTIREMSDLMALLRSAK